MLSRRGTRELLRVQKPPDPFFNVADFVPDLRESFKERPFDPKKILLAAIPIKDPEAHQGVLPSGAARPEISLTDGKEFWFWETHSLRALFRGDKQPPVLGDEPEAYNDVFMLLDLHVLEISKFFGDRRDAEMREVYAALRKKPDGPSRGFVHDYLWQAAALVLGTRPLSQAEFEAIMARLERSCRTFELSPSSRNYVAALRVTFGQEE